LLSAKALSFLFTGVTAEFVNATVTVTTRTRREANNTKQAVPRRGGFARKHALGLRFARLWHRLDDKEAA